MSKIILGYIVVWLMRFCFVTIALLFRADRFFLLSLFLLVLMIFKASNGTWVGDFWVHSDVVRELSTHLLHPKHPEYLLDAPHPYFTPYSLVVAAFSRLFHWDSITALAIAGIINLLLLLFGLDRFLRSVFGDGRRSFYTLFFLLFLWGISPWFYSGFIHFRLIGYVLAYPSIFAMAMVFWAISMVINWLKNKDQAMPLALIACAVIILLSHPFSWVVLSIGMLAFLAGHPESCNRQRIFILSIIPVSFLIALAWPYYPLMQLFLCDARLYDVHNVCMYQDVILRIFPCLIALPLIVTRWKAKHHDPLVLMFIGLGLLYLYGGFSGHYMYGRAIFFLVLILHILLADWICQHESFKQLSLKAKGYFILILASAIWGLYHHCNAKAIDYMPTLSSNYRPYLFLSQYVGQYDVVISDPQTSLFIPSFGGKVIHNDQPFTFVSDGQERIRDIDIFFSPAASLSDRLEIIKKYKVSFILIDQSNPISQHLRLKELGTLGREVYRDKQFVLLKVS